jgi:phenylpyruvate tautomerase PptA (4-oxalocrotonate tautomerase family)
MPHVVVKLYSGRSEGQKQALAQAVTEAVTRALDCGQDSVSVGIEDIDPKDLDGDGLHARHHRQAAYHLQETRVRPAIIGGIQ